MQDFKVAEEVAVVEVKAFIEYHLDEEISAEQVNKDYRDVVKAVMRGNLDLSNNDAPKLKLMKEIKSENGQFDVSEISFKTRVTKSQLATLAKGIDFQKDTLLFANRMTAFLIGFEAVSMLDLLGKHDTKTIDQLTGLFQ